jgi:aminoglycoside 6'-N-acetyltransferase I
LREALWPGADRDQLALGQQARLWDPTDTTCLVAVAPDRSLVGFAELSVRTHAEGCHPGRVAYLEAWYVVPSWRGRGVGRTLLTASERWAREHGCTELATDADASDEHCHAAHLTFGFTEVRRLTCFRKQLQEHPPSSFLLPPSSSST